MEAFVVQGEIVYAAAGMVVKSRCRVLAGAARVASAYKALPDTGARTTQALLFGAQHGRLVSRTR